MQKDKIQCPIFYLITVVERESGVMKKLFCEMTTFFSLRIYAIRTAISEIKNKLNKRILNVILKLHYLEGKKIK